MSYISDLWVAPAAQGRGIGTALARSGLKPKSPRWAIPLAELETLAGNSRRDPLLPAARLCRHRGASRSFPRRCGYAIDKVGLPSHSESVAVDRFMTLIDTRTPNPKSFIKGQTGDWEVIIGMEVHAQVTSESKLFSGSLDRVRPAAQFQCELRRRGDAGHAAGDQRGMRAAGGAHRARAQGADQQALDLRPQELLLSGPAAGLPDHPVQGPHRRRGQGAARHARGARSRSASSGCISSRTPASRSTTSTRT